MLAPLGLLPLHRIRGATLWVGLGGFGGAFALMVATPLGTPVHILAQSLMHSVIMFTLLTPYVWRPAWLDRLWRSASDEAPMVGTGSRGV